MTASKASDAVEKAAKSGGDTPSQSTSAAESAAAPSLALMSAARVAATVTGSEALTRLNASAAFSSTTLILSFSKDVTSSAVLFSNASPSAMASSLTTSVKFALLPLGGGS